MIGQLRAQNYTRPTFSAPGATPGRPSEDKSLQQFTDMVDDFHSALENLDHPAILWDGRGPYQQYPYVVFSHDGETYQVTSLGSSRPSETSYFRLSGSLGGGGYGSKEFHVSEIGTNSRPQTRFRYYDGARDEDFQILDLPDTKVPQTLQSTLAEIREKLDTEVWAQPVKV